MRDDAPDQPRTLWSQQIVRAFSARVGQGDSLLGIRGPSASDVRALAEFCVSLAIARLPRRSSRAARTDAVVEAAYTLRDYLSNAPIVEIEYVEYVRRHLTIHVRTRREKANYSALTAVIAACHVIAAVQSGDSESDYVADLAESTLEAVRLAAPRLLRRFAPSHAVTRVQDFYLTLPPLHRVCVQEYNI